MTIVGPDRPGLVDSVAALVAEHKGNWLESRMSRLGGQFAGILRVEVSAGSASDLEAALRKLDSQWLAIVVTPDTSTVPIEASSARTSLLEVVGQDRPGIVSQIARVLAGYGVNVEELHTECSSAAMSGETLFKARAKLSIPESCDSSEIRRKLEKIAEDLIVEITFAELEAS
jgi:glycine cleavage system regulatory protein